MCCLSDMYVDPKWQYSSSHSSFMDGVSPVLYRLVVRPDLSKFTQVSKFLAAAQIFTISCENSKILSQLLSVLSLPRKFIYDHCCCPNSAIILTVSKMKAILDFGRGCFGRKIFVDARVLSAWDLCWHKNFYFPLLASFQILGKVK